MEVQLLKERASQLACPGSQGMASVFENLIYTYAFIAKRRTGVPVHHSGKQNVKIVTGSLWMKYGLTFALVSLLISLPPLAMGQSPDTPESEGAASTEIGGSAQRVYLDPQTGRLLRQPPPGAQPFILSPAELNMISTSHQGLVERRLPSGGYVLDLKGRFRSMAVATVAEDGTIVIQEVAGEAFLPVSSEQSEKNEKNE